MIQIPYGLPSSGLETAPSLLGDDFPCQSGRRRFRHFLVGTQADTQDAIDRLHRLGYAERIEWSRIIAIPENGIVIRPDPGDVLRYLQRYRPRVE